VRLPRIDESDLNLFEFDYDLTFMVFFLSADEKIYARYGGRDAVDADNRQSLAGLKYTMQAVLEAHRHETRTFAPRTDLKPRFIREVTSGGGRCLHCHQVREALNRKIVADGEWSRDLVWRYPLPENLGFRLEVNRGNVVERITADSPAARVGLKKGDIVRALGRVPITSFADAQHALDRAPNKGQLAITWTRDHNEMTGTIDLVQGWKKSDITWRPSMRRLIPTVPFSGTDLKTSEKKALGLDEKRLAYRQGTRLFTRAREAGIQTGDVILGIEGKALHMTSDDFHEYVRREYLVGDRITWTILRNGKTMNVPMILTGR
jgi:predicted metalloprotease with PDZ domain